MVQSFIKEKIDTGAVLVEAGGSWSKNYIINSSQERMISEIKARGPKGTLIVLADSDKDINPDCTEIGAFPIDLKQYPYSLGPGSALTISIKNPKQHKIKARVMVDLIKGPARRKK